MINLWVLTITIYSSQTADAHDHNRRDHNPDHHEMNHHQDQGNLRRLGIFDNVSELLSSNQPCKDGEPTFTVGNVTYACRSDFQRKGGVCGTAPMSPDRKAKAEEHFLQWKDFKDKLMWHDHRDQGEGRRSLGGCGGDCVEWSTAIITIPTYFHVIHSGTTGKKFTYTSNPAYIRNQIKAMNVGFRGEVNTAFTPYPSRSYPRYIVSDADTKIQFCLAGTTATDNTSWYNANNDYAMKSTLKRGGSESLNVYVNTAGGFLGYAYFPDTQDFVEDGVVILNDSMPGGAETGFNEGDTLTHEVGHWLELDHTHDNGCGGSGDYMNLAPPSTNYNSVKSCESEATFDCPTSLNNCAGDGGKNPIHSFMSYVDDNCMDQFTPGQKMKVQQAWETYRHKLGYSELVSLAADGYSCILPGMPTSTPTSGLPTSLQPTSSPTTQQPTKAPIPTKQPTSKPSPQPSTKRPTKQPTKRPTRKPVKK